MRADTGTRLDLLRKKIILQLGNKLQVERREIKQGHMLKGKCVLVPELQ